MTRSAPSIRKGRHDGSIWACPITVANSSGRHEHRHDRPVRPADRDRLRSATTAGWSGAIGPGPVRLVTMAPSLASARLKPSASTMGGSADPKGTAVLRICPRPASREDHAVPALDLRDKPARDVMKPFEVGLRPFQRGRLRQERRRGSAVRREFPDHRTQHVGGIADGRFAQGMRAFCEPQDKTQRADDDDQRQQRGDDEQQLIFDARRNPSRTWRPLAIVARRTTAYEARGEPCWTKFCIIFRW